MKSNNAESLVSLLNELSLLLKTMQLASESPPSPDAMNSTAPFACDTMSLADWLEYIFIPKMLEMIVKGSVLPTEVSVAPIAEYHYGHGKEYQSLIALIKKLDSRLQRGE